MQYMYICICVCIMISIRHWSFPGRKGVGYREKTNTYFCRATKVVAVFRRKRAEVHLLDWHDSSFRRLRPPATISIARSRPVFATIALDHDDGDDVNGYYSYGIQLTPRFNGVEA